MNTGERRKGEMENSKFFVFVNAQLKCLPD